MSKKMRKPKRYGQLWVSFGDDGQPKYGFETEEGRLKRIVWLSDERMSKFILPCIENFAKVGKGDVDIWQAHFKKKRQSESFAEKMGKYIEGAIVIGDGCFAGCSGNLTITLPNDCPVLIMPNAFDKAAKVQFMLKQGMGLMGFTASSKNGTTSGLLVGKNFLAGLPEFNSSFGKMQLEELSGKNSGITYVNFGKERVYTGGRGRKRKA